MENYNHDIEKELGFRPKLHPMFDNIENNEVLSPEDVANMLKVSNETVRRWCRTGKLPNYSFGGKYVIIGSDFKEFMRNARSRLRGKGSIRH
ncbi:helix-turn-helix domain-containing protein [Parageobacillus toebii NBRC 107807]|uniref:Excisionase family DNA binding protein n=1 Tax=Parageobacillus toebii NBRC 107807 TaxID=1223503 RepID=A0A6G9J1J2_9BACL|nr:helix-turn-helix domain-containing protein [Parageobacillus toebii]MBB3868680.1 excisionase family DNA binding protein [Parageobacillus toebii NBRC 107807]QIQ32042.1 helix-turn-helix domain-containing protein [Parageobacillus toebii NBRC 107807]